MSEIKTSKELAAYLQRPTSAGSASDTENTHTFLLLHTLRLSSANGNRVDFQELQILSHAQSLGYLACAHLFISLYTRIAKLRIFSITRTHRPKRRTANRARKIALFGRFKRGFSQPDSISKDQAGTS